MTMTHELELIEGNVVHEFRRFSNGQIEFSYFSFNEKPINGKAYLEFYEDGSVRYYENYLNGEICPNDPYQEFTQGEFFLDETQNV